MFASIDLRALAIFRMLLASSVLVDVFDRSRARWLIDNDALVEVGSWSFHRVVGVGACSVIAAGAAVALAVGVRTRIAALVCLVFTASLQEASRLTSFGGDGLLIVELFWCCWLPVGARLSVDSGWDRRGGVARSAAVVGLLLQPVLLYVGGAIAKLGAPSWRDGSALHETLTTWLVTTPLGARCADAPPDILRLLCWFTLAVEFVGPLLLFSRRPRLRVLAFLALTLLQAGMTAMLSVGWFAIVSIASTVPHLPSVLWRDQRDAVLRTSGVSNVVVGAAVAIATVTAFALPWVPVPTVRPLTTLGLQQTFTMFRDPARLPHGYFYVVATGRDGVLRDLVTGVVRPTGSPPDVAAADLLPFRERMALTALLFPEAADLLPAYGVALCSRERDIVAVHGLFFDERLVGVEAVAPGGFVELFDVNCAGADRPPVSAGR